MSRDLLKATCASVALFLTGCGSTHQFLPHKPLPNGEWEYSLVWSFDLNCLSPPSVIPEANFYRGLGKGYVIGAGWIAPMLVTHLTPAKYWVDGGGDYWVAGVHANKVLSVDASPLWEVCVGYCVGGTDADGSLLVGIGYQHAAPLPMWIDPKEVATDHRILPMLKASIASAHWGVSYQHKFGEAAALLAPLTADVIRWQDTLRRISPDDIVEVNYGFVPGIHRVDSLAIRLSDSTVLEFHKYTPGSCMPVPGRVTRDYRSYWLLARNYDELLYSEGRGDSGHVTCATIRADLGELIKASARGDSVIVALYPPAILSEIRRSSKSVFDGMSLGIAFKNKFNPDSD
jgi:hypothetical protein